MMKIFITFIIVFLLYSCIPKKSAVNLLPLTKEEISGERLYERITKESNYKKFPMWPGHEGYKEGQSPHGRIHRIFINNVLYKALPIKNKLAPEGSIVIKENYNIEKEYKGMTVMVKVKDFAPESNDWYWVNYDNNGNKLLNGKISFCIECHAGMKDNDYIIVKPLDK